MTDTSRLGEVAVRDLIARLGTSDPIPGGGSAAAIAGAMGAALVQMVVALTLGRPAFADHEDALREVGADAELQAHQLLALADDDAAAYEAVVAARRLPRATDAEREARATRIANSTREATIVPLRTAQAASRVLDLAERVAPIGNPNAASDVGVAAQLASAAVRGAGLNVRINLPYLAADDDLRSSAEVELDALLDGIERREADIVAAATARMG